MASAEYLFLLQRAQLLKGKQDVTLRNIQFKGQSLALCGASVQKALDYAYL